MIGFDEAIAVVARAATPLGSENVPIAEAHDRVLAAPVHALVDSPPCDVSAMDGYALRDGDVGAAPARLRVVGESFAGHGFTGTFAAGECVRIFTGAPLPAGADRVVIQERVRRDGDVAVIEAVPGPSRNIRRRGSDFAAGELLLPAGRVLDYRAIVAAAGADMAAVEVWRRPRVALLATGDELVAPGAARDSDRCIPESVSFGALALARRCGAEAAARVRVPDDLPAMARAAAEAVAGADLVVVTGGASVGEKDFARDMFAPLGLELLFSKVAIKPGKPVWLGRAGGALVLGLPGNPTSALVTARLFMAPLLAGLTGRVAGTALAWRTLPLAAPLPPAGERETFMRARLNDGAAEPMANQESSAQRTLADSDLLLRRRAGAPAAAAGEMVEALDL